MMASASSIYMRMTRTRRIEKDMKVVILAKMAIGSVKMNKNGRMTAEVLFIRAILLQVNNGRLH